MRWFKKDNRVYVGPLSDDQIDHLMSSMVDRGAGIACMAGSGRVETYVTLPEDPTVIKTLSHRRIPLEAA